MGEDSWRKTTDLTYSVRNGYPFYKDLKLSFSTMKMLSWSIPTSASPKEVRWKVAVRRLSTISYIDAKPIERFTTGWRWYYQDDGQWHEPEMALQHDCEQEYQLYLLYGKDRATMPIQTGDEQEMFMDFEEMKLYMKSGFHDEMSVRRRPLLLDSSSLSGQRLFPAKTNVSLGSVTGSTSSHNTQPKSPEMLELERKNKELELRLASMTLDTQRGLVSPVSDAPGSDSSSTIVGEGARRKTHQSDEYRIHLMKHVQGRQRSGVKTEKECAIQ